MCDEQYAHGQADHHCTLLDARVLDAPITDVILRCCRFTEHAEAVLAQLEAEYDTTREDARRRQRERRRLREEIDTLKQNLVLTRTPEHVGLIFERIDRRMQRLAELADTEPGGPRRVLSAAQVATVRVFLADLRTGWDQQPPGLCHEFVRLILDRVVINADRDHLEVTIIWRTRVQQHLWIERPQRSRPQPRGRLGVRPTRRCYAPMRAVPSAMRSCALNCPGAAGMPSISSVRC